MNFSRKKLLILLLVVILVCTLTVALFACNNEVAPTPDNNGEDEKPPEEETLIIANGSFKNTSGKTYPMSPENWTGAPGSSSSSGTGTPQGAESLVSGVISVEETAYNKNKGIWGNAANPGKQGEDDNILMIYNKVPTAYNYSNTFKTEPGKYYKVSISVKTIISDGDEGKGAYIYLTDGAYAAFEKIDTGNIWKTYNIYLESSLISSSSVKVILSLGYGNTDSKKMTKGYAFFDEVVAEEITSQEYAEQNLNNTTAIYTMRVPDSRMDYASGTIQPYSPYDYSKKSGTGAGGTAPGTSIDTAYGIVDTADWKDEFGINPGSPDIDYGTKILMLKNKTATAQGYAGRKQIRFSIGGYYELNVDVYVLLSDGQSNLEFKGATLALTGTENFKIQYINTEGRWLRYSFFVQANEIRDKDLSLEMWLGQGGKEDTDTLTKGVAFFDNVTLKSITKATYEAEVANKEANPEGYKNYVASLVSKNPNLISNYNLENINNNTGLPTGWQAENSSKDVIVNAGDVRYISISAEDLDAAEWTKTLEDKYYGLIDNPKAPYPTMAPVFMINNRIPTVSGMGLIGSLSIKSNLHYRMAIWLKTVGIEEGKGITVKLMGMEGGEDKEIVSFTDLNTATYENSYTNDYVEIVFYLQGNEIMNKTVRPVIEIGSGTAYDPSKFILGNVLVANVNMEEVTHTEYTSAKTSSYVKSHSFAQATSTVTNGNFNKIDLSKTELDNNGKLKDKPGVPESFTASSSVQTNVISGIIDITNAGLMNALGLTNVYNNDGWTKPYPVDFGSPNLLYIRSAEADGEFDGMISPFGYSSANFSMSKDSFYVIRAYVKTTNGGRANILLSSTTNTANKEYDNIDTDGKWSEYIFAVATGRNSISTKIELFLGNKGSDTKVSGAAFFDSISYQKIEEDEYLALADNNQIISLSYQLETFDNYKSSQTGMPSPENWTGTLGNSSLPSGTANILSGVLSKITGKFEDFCVRDKDGNIIEASKLNNEDMRNLIFSNANTVIGDNVLVINNKVPTAYNYKISSSETLVKNNYYEISVWAFTYYLEEGKTARIMLSIGEDTFTFKNVNTTTYVDGVPQSGTWTKYSYYIKSAESADTPSTYLTVGLGKYLASDTDKAQLVSGYAFYDNVTITKIDKEAFDLKNDAFNLAKAENATAEEKAFLNTNSVIIVDEPESSTPSDPSDEKPDEEKPKDTTPWLLITYISSAIIGAVIIIVVAVVMFRKISPKIAARRRLKFKKTSYDRTSPKDKTSTKSTRYDKYKD